MHDKNKKVLLLEVITAVVIVWLPIDLLYLYFAGGWTDPNWIILGVELVVLFLLPIFGIWRVYYLIRAERKRRGKNELGEGVDKSVQKL